MSASGRLERLKQEHRLGKVTRHISNGEEVPRTVLELKGDTVVEYRNVMMNVEVDERLRQALKDACKSTNDRAATWRRNTESWRGTPFSIPTTHEGKGRDCDAVPYPRGIK